VDISEANHICSLFLVLVLLEVFGVAIIVQRVGASGSIHIRADGSIEPPTASITSADNVTFIFTGEIYESIVIERDNIVVDGQAMKFKEQEAEQE